MTPPKKAKPKTDPDAPVKVERSARRVTEMYAWSATMRVQGENMRFLEIIGTDGKESIRVMNIDDAVAKQLAGMLVPEPSE